MEQLVDILYEDEFILVLNKPNGILTTAPPGIDSMAIRVREYLKWRHHKTGDIYVGIVHRLDRPASGAIVFGLTSKMTRRMCEQFQLRTVQKTYIVGVEGHVDSPSATWRDTIRKIPDVARAELVPLNHPEGKLALLSYQSEKRTDKSEILSIQLQTGRTHQIRVQCSSRGHAVLGDHDYGSSIPFGPTTADPRARHIALHAKIVEFDHPKSGERLRIEAPLPPTFEALLSDDESS